MVLDIIERERIIEVIDNYLDYLKSISPKVCSYKITKPKLPRKLKKKDKKEQVLRMNILMKISQPFIEVTIPLS